MNAWTRKWFKRAAIAITVLIVFVLFVLLPVGGSFLITNSRFRFPERGPGSPSELGLRVEDVEFKTGDGLTLGGWWDAGDTNQPVVLFAHGLNRSRLELLDRAAEARKRGYGVLLLDFRNHGSSSRGYTTLGIHETRDLCAARDFVRMKSPGRRQLLWGVSMGASTALLAVRTCGGFAGVVADSPFLSFRDTVQHHFTLVFRAPSFPIADMIVALTGWRMDFDPDEGDVEAAVRAFGDVPALFIAGGRDRRMPPEVVRKLYDSATSPRKQFLLIPEAGHGEAIRADRSQYLDVVFRFLVIIRSDTDLTEAKTDHGNNDDD